MADKMEVAEGSLSPAVDQPEPEQQPDHKGSRKKSEKHCRIFLIRTLALSHVTTDLLSSVSSHLELEIKNLILNLDLTIFFYPTDYFRGTLHYMIISSTNVIEFIALVLVHDLCQTLF